MSSDTEILPKSAAIENVYLQTKKHVSVKFQDYLQSVLRSLRTLIFMNIIAELRTHIGKEFEWKPWP